MKYFIGVLAGTAAAFGAVGCSPDEGDSSQGSGGDAGASGESGGTGSGSTSVGGTDGTGDGGEGDSGGQNGTGGEVEGGTGGSVSSAGGASNDDCDDTGAAENFSFFVTSYHHIKLLSGSDNGFGGDLRYGGATTGLAGADAICQEMARRVCHGHKEWKAYLSTSTEDAIDRVGSGPWYDYAGVLVAQDTSGLTSGDRPAGGCCDVGTYDEVGTFHDGTSDINGDGQDDDDHDTLTSTGADGTFSGFSCEDWMSTTAVPEGGETGPVGPGGPGGPGGDASFAMGHTWPAMSGQSWVSSHGGHGCGAGTNFIQNGPGSEQTVGAGGGYGAFYCFALDVGP